MTLTLPGTIQGLLRRGSPVVAVYGFPSPTNDCTPYQPGETGVVMLGRPSGGSFSVACWNTDLIESWPETASALDLTDATGRAHAAWWLGKVDCYWRCGWMRWGWATEPPPYSAQEKRFFILPEHWDPGLHEDGQDCIKCEFLAHLDPTNPSLLPDGSRWVDAEALRLVCLHVAGVKP